MEEDYGYEYAMGMEKKKGVGYYIGKTLKFLCIAVIVFIYGFFIVRLMISGDPSEVKGFAWNDVGIAAYNNASDKFEVKKQDVTTEFTPDGTFRVTNIKFVESTGDDGKGQVQIVVRYNNSTLKTVAAAYGLSALPEGEAFVYVLKDADGNEYTEYEFRGFKKNVYNYRQLIFDGVDITNAGTLTLDFYYVDDVTKGYPFASLVVYDEDGYMIEEFDISDDLPPTLTDGFRDRPAYLVKEAAK